MSAINVHLTSFAGNPVELLAQHVITSANSLPLLTNTIIFTPQANVAAELRYTLLKLAQQQQHSALLGPQILPLHQWLKSFQPGELKVVNATTQELILVEALQQHQGMFASVNPWIYAHSLLELFQSLTANNIALPENEDDFTQLLGSAYGIEKITSIDALSQEAHFIYTLWCAWHEQLSAYNVVDSEAAQLLYMQQALDKLPTDNKINFYFSGYDLLTKTEMQWLEQLAQQHNVFYFLQGNMPDTSLENIPYHAEKHIEDCIKQFSACNIIPALEKDKPDELKPSKLEFIKNVFAINTAPLVERARQYHSGASSPLKNIHVYSANDDEQEARAVDIQLRRWLLEGKTKLAIVTENRRLARRVRALLERSGVNLQDAAGWALSTTRAAATVERWLECIENDFNYLSLLDLLKSSFIFPQIDVQALQYAVYRLEQDIIRHENIHQHIPAYRAGIKSRAERLPEWFSETHSIIDEVLDQLEQAAEPLLRLTSNENMTPQQFIQTISDSLHVLGLNNTLSADAAGIKIINLLDELTAESDLVNLTFNWTEARAWLALQMERSRFMPPSSETQVQLIGLSQSAQQKFDGLIIAAVEEEFLPGTNTPSAFFNDAVKHELGLNTSLVDKNERFHHFIRLLHSSEHILLSYRNQGDNGEVIKPSAWLALLEQFHQLAFNKNLTDDKLNQLVNAPENTFTHTAEQPAATAQQPAPPVPENLIPGKISASQYQELINCPYLFYSARCLKLEATDEMREALSKADFGERIHQCLEAFHHKKEGFPANFKNKLSEHNKEAASKVLDTIIEHVFSHDLADNHEHLAWYTQAKKMVPLYIDWQIKHNQDWTVYKVEKNITTELNIENTGKPLKLSGRLDRIDKTVLDDKTEVLDVIDYKTGVISSNKEVETGEQVQLPFYHTLLQEDDRPVHQVEYLEVTSSHVKTKATLKGDKLDEIAAQSTERLQAIFKQLHNETGLPAWGDDKTCKRCNMQGICRKQMWQDSQP